MLNGRTIGHHPKVDEIWMKHTIAREYGLHPSKVTGADYEFYLAAKTIEKSKQIKFEDQIDLKEKIEAEQQDGNTE